MRCCLRRSCCRAPEGAVCRACTSACAQLTEAQQLLRPQGAAHLPCQGCAGLCAGWLPSGWHRWPVWVLQPSTLCCCTGRASLGGRPLCRQGIGRPLQIWPAVRWPQVAARYRGSHWALSCSQWGPAAHGLNQLPRSRQPCTAEAPAGRPAPSGEQPRPGGPAAARVLGDARLMDTCSRRHGGQDHLRDPAGRPRAPSSCRGASRAWPGLTADAASSLANTN